MDRARPINKRRIHRRIVNRSSSISASLVGNSYPSGRCEFSSRDRKCTGGATRPTLDPTVYLPFRTVVIYFRVNPLFLSARTGADSCLFAYLLINATRCRPTRRFATWKRPDASFRSSRDVPSIPPSHHLND